ncbi:hypothetical protein H6503_03860 [Candidatus Woesearchaeota archaeon]|nr:hypothetical protein [Candidatus Woesearchaeota archaeon]
MAQLVTGKKDGLYLASIKEAGDIKGFSVNTDDFLNISEDKVDAEGCGHVELSGLVVDACSRIEVNDSRGILQMQALLANLISTGYRVSNQIGADYVQAVLLPQEVCGIKLEEIQQDDPAIGAVLRFYENPDEIVRKAMKMSGNNATITWNRSLMFYRRH